MSALHFPRISLYAGLLAASGIPLYIHLPQFASVELGLGLGTIGALLLVVRIVDLVQDPILGWAIDRWPGAQGAFGLAAALGLALGFPWLFALTPGPGVAWPLTGALLLVFLAYSLGTILLYGRSATLAESPGDQGLLTVATWREGGSLAGVILAAILPSVLAGYALFGLVLGGLALVTALACRPLWRRRVVPGGALSVKGLAQAGALRLLALALVNSLPVAITSTLFLFFVEDRLGRPGAAGPLLVLFFLSAGLSVPVWSRVAGRIGARATLAISMPLAILGFAGTAFLPVGEVWGFALICLAAGAALGADTMLLPAMFSMALTRAGLQASLAFGIWAFAGKLGLALAAFMVMPVLEWQGFTPGGLNSAEALSALNIAYAVVPCVLKLVAWAAVLALPK